MQIKTKQQLLDAIKECEKDKAKIIFQNSQKEKYYNDGIDGIKRILAYYTDDDFPEFDSLKFDNKFKDFVLNAKDSELKDRLDLICHDLYEFSKYHVKANLVERMNGKMKLSLKIIVAIIAIMALLSVVFMILHFIYGNNFMWGRADDIADAIGILDFAIGALGFVWERCSDMNKTANIAKIDEAIQSKDSKRFVKIVTKIDNSINKTIGFINIIFRSENDKDEHNGW